LRYRSLTLGWRSSGALREQQPGRANGGDRGGGGDQSDMHSHDVKDLRPDLTDLKRSPLLDDGSAQSAYRDLFDGR